jgi:hypothetical protein
VWWLMVNEVLGWKTGWDGTGLGLWGLMACSMDGFWVIVGRYYV